MQAEGSNAKLFTGFIERDACFSLQGGHETFPHGLTLEQIGGFFFRLQFVLQVDGHDHRGDGVVLIRDVLHLSHNSLSGSLPSVP